MGLEVLLPESDLYLPLGSPPTITQCSLLGLPTLAKVASETKFEASES